MKISGHIDSLAEATACDRYVIQMNACTWVEGNRHCQCRARAELEAVLGGTNLVDRSENPVLSGLQQGPSTTS